MLGVAWGGVAWGGIIWGGGKVPVRSLSRRSRRSGKSGKSKSCQEPARTIRKTKILSGACQEPIRTIKTIRILGRLGRSGRSGRSGKSKSCQEPARSSRSSRKTKILPGADQDLQKASRILAPQQNADVVDGLSLFLLIYLSEQLLYL